MYFATLASPPRTFQVFNLKIARINRNLWNIPAYQNLYFRFGPIIYNYRSIFVLLTTYFSSFQSRNCKNINHKISKTYKINLYFSHRAALAIIFKIFKEINRWHEMEISFSSTLLLLISFVLLQWILNKNKIYWHNCILHHLYNNNMHA